MPRLTRRFNLAFYGGEPLLEFGLIRETVTEARRLSRPAGRRPRFSITTNGSLVDGTVLDFFDRERFAVTLSYDGERQDLERRPGSGRQLGALIGRLVGRPRIRLEVNSVFTPAGVGSLSRTLLSLIDQGVSSVHFSLSVLEPWTAGDIARLGRELDELKASLVRSYGRIERSPVANFRDQARRRLRFCSAGEDRMAVDPDGRIWGCVLFADYGRDRGGASFRRRFSFGSLRRSARRSEASFQRTSDRYAQFSMDRARTSRRPCFLCSWVDRCWVCPIKSALAGGALSVVPDFVCAMQQSILS